MKPVWIIDADGIENNDDFINNVYYSTKVKAFLEEDKKLGIAATKGFGKTFLLKVKRNIMQNKNIYCIPKDSMLDTLVSPRFNSSNINFFKNYTNWVLLWECSIAAAIINSVEKININKYSELLGEDVLFLLGLGFNRPSDYFALLLNMERKRINLIFNKANFLVNLLRDIRFSICVFIDKVDQSLATQTEKIVGQTKMSTGPRNASFWQFAQLSLLEAAYNFISVNPHIKVYFSIRKEALLDYAKISTSVNQNLIEYFIELDYDYIDLEKMFNQYIEYEKEENLILPDHKYDNPSLAFVGLDVIKSKYVRNKKEKFFDYIFRHTFMRPRDIMDICYQLSISDLKNQKQLEDKIREIVNKESKIILESFLSETDNFLINISRDQIEEVCQLLNYNVINLNYAKYVCKRLNEIYSLDESCDSTSSFNCDKNCDLCNSLHPFCSLYNIGLIGNLWESRTEDSIIRFNIINDSAISKPIHCFPSSELYFLHPCFASKAEHIRKNSSKDFDFNKNVIVGNNIKVKKNSIKNISIQVDDKFKKIRDERIFISSTCFDLHDERVMVDDVLTDIGFDVVRSDGEKFNTTLDGVHSHDHCIDELKKCKYVVFIISRRYGGKYSGKKYQKEAEEIVKINPKINQPSISLMEYYVARKAGIETHVFVDTKVYNERLSYKANIKYNPNYCPSFADDNRVFELIDFVTKQETNNWFREYNDFQNLGELIKIVFEDK